MPPCASPSRTSAAARAVSLACALVLTALVVAPASAQEPPPVPPVAAPPAAAQADPGAERAERERLEAERLEAERVEAERLERERIEREEREVQRGVTLRERIARAQRELEDAERVVLAALARRNRAAGAVVVAGYDLDDGRARLADSEARIAEAADELEAAREDEVAAQDAFARQVARAYRAGSSARSAPMVAVDALLQTGSPAQFVDGMAYLDSVLGNGADRVTAAAAAVVEWTARRRAAERDRGDALASVAQAEDALAAAQATLPGREAELAAAFSAHGRRSAELLRAAAAERAATLEGEPHPSRAANVRLADQLGDIATGAAAAVERIRSGSARSAAGAAGVGAWRDLACPVDGPVQFTNDWGFPRSGGRSHEGTDVFAERGTPVVAMADATVVRVARHDVGLGGLAVTYEVDGYRVYNAHLDTVAAAVEPGAHVRQGQVLGTVGTTGNATFTPPHDHVGLHGPDGAPLNPYPLLRRACR